MLETTVFYDQGLGLVLQYSGRGSGSVLCVCAVNTGEANGPRDSVFPDLQNGCVVALKEGHFINKIQRGNRLDTDPTVDSVHICDVLSLRWLVTPDGSCQRF